MGKKSLYLIFISLLFCFSSCLPEKANEAKDAPEIFEIWEAEKVVVSYHNTSIYVEENDWHKPPPTYGSIMTPYAYCFYKDGRYHEFAEARYLNEFLEAPDNFTPGFHDNPDGTTYLISGLERWKMDNQFFYSTWNGGRYDAPEDYNAFYQIISQNQTQIVLRLLKTSGITFPPDEENYQYTATFKRIKPGEIQQ